MYLNKFTEQWKGLKSGENWWIFLKSKKKKKKWKAVTNCKKIVKKKLYLKKNCEKVKKKIMHIEKGWKVVKGGREEGRVDQWEAWKMIMQSQGQWEALK